MDSAASRYGRAFPGRQLPGLWMPSAWGLAWRNKRCNRARAKLYASWSMARNRSVRMSESVVAGPLQGKRILVTRTREQASFLSEQLNTYGATPVEFPTIRIVPPQDWSALDAALRRLYTAGETAYDWLVL